MFLPPVHKYALNLGQENPTSEKYALNLGHISTPQA